MVDSKVLDDQISELFLSDLDLDVASPDTDLLEAGVLDSALVIEILLLLEQRFGLQIPMEELELDDLRSIHSIAELVADRSR